MKVKKKKKVFRKQKISLLSDLFEGTSGFNLLRVLSADTSTLMF